MGRKGNAKFDQVSSKVLSYFAAGPQNELNYFHFRMHQNGIPCPKPHLLKGHVLLMEFMGSEGWPAPQLKDVSLEPEEAQKLYEQLIFIMRSLYRNCRLVHADLSEYNLMYFHIGFISGLLK